MAIQQNAILQMVEILADAFEENIAADIDEDRALFAIEEALAEVFRTRRELLFMRPEEMIEEFDPRLAAEVGRLFYEHSRISESQGHAEASAYSYALSVQALRMSVGQSLSRSQEDATDLMRRMLRSERILTVLDAEQMAETWRDIFEHEARSQHHALAEDALFHAIDLSAEPTDHIRRGLRHYDKLLKLPDDVLEEGGLTRAEAEQAARELQKLRV
jgi:hypothetical protein